MEGTVRLTDNVLYVPGLNVNLVHNCHPVEIQMDDHAKFDGERTAFTMRYSQDRSWQLCKDFSRACVGSTKAKEKEDLNKTNTVFGMP